MSSGHSPAIAHRREHAAGPPLGLQRPGEVGYLPHVDGLRGLANTSHVEVIQHFCDETLCRMNAPGALLYRDTNHLNLNGSRLVGEHVARASGL